MAETNGPGLPLSMRLKHLMSSAAQWVSGRLVPMQELLVAIVSLIHTLRTTHRNPLDIPEPQAQQGAEPVHTTPLALAGEADAAAALPPGRPVEDEIITIEVNAVEVVDDGLGLEFARERLERGYAMPDDVHAPAVRALDAAFAHSAITAPAANDNGFGAVGRAGVGILPAAQGGGRGNDGNGNQALNVPENSSDLAERLREIAQLAEHSQSEAVSAMRHLMTTEADRIDTSWPQITRAAEQNPRLQSVLDTAFLGDDRSASNG